jgi:N-acetyl-anhydromuramyl-L-alanine amidase AmpD
MQENNKPKINRARRRLIRWGSLSACAIGLGLYWPNRWKYIVVHHSAGNYGTIEFLQQVHRDRQAGDPIDAIPYHYVIGNGNGLKLGEVASDWREQNSLWGAHVSGRNRDRNFRGLGICLIGNFEKDQVPTEQYASLLKLTKELMLRHSIPPSNVTGHGLTNGEMTLCPGKHFPMEQLKKDLMV